MTNNHRKIIILEKYINSIIKKLFEVYDWGNYIEQHGGSSREENDPVMNALSAMEKAPSAQEFLKAQPARRQQTFSDLLQNNKESMFQKGIDISKLKHLGEGAGGIAYDIGNGNVFKATTDSSEAKSSNLLKGKDYKGLIKIFDVWKFPNSNYYGIIMEKIIPFKQWTDDQLKDDILEIVDTFGLKEMLQKYHSNWDAVWKEISESPLLSLSPSTPKNLRKAFLMLAIVGSSLESAGITGFFDLHTGNIGKRQNGDVVVFDIGFAKGGIEPAVLGSN